MTDVQLRTFLAVCESMSFTQAAKQQYISQPAVSRQMAGLEDSLGVTLFERSRSSIQLTPAGQHFARNLRPIVAHLDALLTQTREIGSGQSGSLVIGLLLDQTIDPKASRALQRFCQRHNVTISIYRYSFMELISHLKSGSIDIAISIETADDMFMGFERHIYVQESVCFAVRKDLLEDGGDRIDEYTIQQLSQQYPILFPRLDTFPQRNRGELEGHLKNDTFAPKGVEYDLASIAPMVAAGLASTMVNESHVLAVDQSIALFNYDATRTMKKGVFWSSDSVNPLVPVFCAILKGLDNGLASQEL